MIKQNKVKIKGRVIDIYPNGIYKVLLDNNITISAYVSGKVRMSKIRILLDDIVEVELSPYDLKQGRIVYRLN